MKRKTQIVALIVLAVFLLLAGFVALVTRSDREEYAVYDAVIRERFSETETIVFQESTLGRRRWLLLIPIVIPMWIAGERIGADYVIKNSAPHMLKDWFGVHHRRAFISWHEFLKHGGLDAPEFHNKYPGARGLIVLSRVGFNRRRDQAEVHIEFLCPLCGWGSYFYLEKQEGVWKLKEERNLWTS